MRRNLDFSRWLTIATRGLPNEIVEFIADELAAHYEDSLYDYLQTGKPEQMAKRAALADLGNPHETGRALRRIHMEKRRYLRAALAAIVPCLLLLIYLPVLLMMHPVIANVVLMILFTAATFCTFDVLKSLAALIDDNPLLALPLHLIRWGIVGTVVVSIVSMIFGMTTSYAVFFVTTDPIMFAGSVNPNGTMTPSVIDQALLPFAAAVAGFGWIMLAIRFETIAHNALPGTLRFVRALCLITGFIMIVQAMSVVIGHRAFLQMSAILLGVFSPIKAGTLTLLFFRAARQNQQQPTMFA